MDYRVVLSDFFISDLKEIVDYLTVRAGSELASRIGHELLNRAMETGHNPFIGQAVKDRPGVRKVLRYSYRIYYDVDESRQVIEVLRIWHGARDPRTLRL